MEDIKDTRPLTPEFIESSDIRRLKIDADEADRWFSNVLANGRVFSLNGPLEFWQKGAHTWMQECGEIFVVVEEANGEEISVKVEDCFLDSFPAYDRYPISSTWAEIIEREACTIADGIDRWENIDD